MTLSRLLPALLLTACAAAPPLVTTAGVLPKPAYRVAGDGAAAAEVTRQLQARGWFAADAATVIRIGYARAPRGVGACPAVNPARPGGCAAWHDRPRTGFGLGPPLRYHLVLVLDGADAARIDVSRGGGKADPLPQLVTAALARLG